MQIKRRWRGKMEGRIRFVLDCRINNCQYKIREAKKELDLLIHRALNFDTMIPRIKNNVIKEINKENKENSFYDDLIIEEVEE